MSEASKVIDTIVKDKLSDYVDVSKVREVKPAKTYTPRKTVTTGRKSTSADDYAKFVPAIKTPSVFSKAKVDEVLMQCRELPTPDKPIKNYAGYSRKEWDTLVDVVARYMADVCEGAGLHYKGMFAAEGLRKALSVAMQENFFHHDPYDKRNRYISVDGRIDSDKRKP